MFRSLWWRLRTAAGLFRRDPSLVARAPYFALRSLKEGPARTIQRLKRLSRQRSTADNYHEWRENYHVPNAETKQAMICWADALENPPQFAVLMPVFNPRPEWLREAIESVCSQLYPHWELCIADDGSTDLSVKALLEDYFSKEPRIKVCFRDVNGHISACSNSALELVSAPWVALMDHDDLLPEDALIWMAEAIVRHPEGKLFYSDEDKIGSDGKHHDPYFKCDWNPLLMEGHNMISHLGMYSADLIREVGGFREGFEGAQDYDLALRCSERLRGDQIVHLPRVLYHWRVHNESTAAGVDAKPYAQEASRRALHEHLKRRNLPVVEVLIKPVGQEALLALPPKPPRVSVLIPTRNGLKVLRPCLQSLLEKTSYPDLEVLVIDNGSDDPSTLKFLEELESAGQIEVLRDPSPFNYSALNNRAVVHASGELVCLMNNDIEIIQEDWLDQMVVQVLRPNVGAVGAKLLYPNRRIQHGGVLLGVGGVAGHAHHGLREHEYGYYNRAQLLQEISAVTAACLLVRRSVYLEAGGLEEAHLRIAFNDVDFCLRLLGMGLRNVYTPAAVLIHHESMTRGYEDTPEKRKRFDCETAWMQRRWGVALTNDPAYNSNLTLWGAPFLLSPSPRVDTWPT